MRINNFNDKGQAIHPISYDINIDMYSRELPALFFHVLGDASKPVTGFCSIDEHTAGNFCEAFNRTFFPHGTETTDVSSVTRPALREATTLKMWVGATLWAIAGGFIVYCLLQIMFY